MCSARASIFTCDGGLGAVYRQWPVIQIDDHELTWEEFGRMLTTDAGWGMRIVFVPDDEVHEEPQIEVREPERKRAR